MTANIFISYSRREVGFVDDLVAQLEKEGHNVWLDYRNLIPGTPWTDQIKAGLERSETVLLVVSKASLASQYVEMEWRHFLEAKQRIILLIFEAVDLPQELEKYEWVDFRGSYKKGLAELLVQLGNPAAEERPAPERGFKIPLAVWIAFGLSLIVALYSFGAAWTLFLPWILAPLPFRIFKRKFNFIEVQTALWVLPVALFLTSLMVAYDEDGDRFFAAALDSLFFIGALLLLLRSRAMQRWGRPEALRPRPAKLNLPAKIQPRPVSYFIDYAPQDRLIADEMTRVFARYGHTLAPDHKTAEVALVLLSTYKTDTEADPQTQVVFPILIQMVEPAAKLSKIQWIDFRSGVRNLDAMAQLLPEPSKLLKALGIRPLGNQLVLPAIVTAMRYFVILLGVFTVGAIMQYILDFFSAGFDLVLGSIEAGGMVLNLLFNLLLIGALTFLMARHLTARKGWFASFWNFTIGLAALGTLIASQTSVDIQAYTMLEALGHSSETSLAIMFPIAVYLIGAAVMAVFLVVRHQDVRRWFPAKVKQAPLKKGS
jgi:hypothetical protein